MAPLLPQPLGGGLTLRAVSSPADAQRFIDLNAAVTSEGDIAARLLHHHPTTTNADYWLVSDDATGAAVSTTCLIPWRFSLDGIPLRVAMLEMVVTDPAFRQRGLVRAQIEHFHAAVAERGFDLCIIQGIPYYYRQYGYAYAIDHTPRHALATHHIPDAPTAAPTTYQFRPATLADVAQLVRLYRAAMARHQLFVERSAAQWRYLLQHKQHPVRLVEEPETGRAVGYMVAVGDRVPASQGLPWLLYEHAVPDYAVGMALLRELKAAAGGNIEVAGPPSDPLVRLAHALGGAARPVTDQWLWRIPNVGALLSRLAPLFERRLRTGGCANYSGPLCINLYRRAFVLQLRQGRVGVESAGFVDASMGAQGGDLNVPPDAFVRLLLGHRTLDGLRDAWPDTLVKPATRYLVELLFPQLDAHILTPY